MKAPVHNERAGSYEQQAWCAELEFSSIDAIVPTQSRNNEEEPAGHWPWGVQATFHVGCSQLSKGKLTKRRVRFSVSKQGGLTSLTKKSLLIQ